jgi:hypothetical protein
MAVATGSQLRPELSAVDYTPFQQAAGQAAQMQAQGIAAASSGLLGAIREYSQNKMASDVLEGENAQMLALMQQVPEYKEFAPNKDILDKYQKKLVAGGLSFADNKKLNAELNVAFKVGDRVLNYRQQQEYAKQAKAATEAALANNARLTEQVAASKKFRTFLTENPNAKDQEVYQFAASSGVPFDELNAYMRGRGDAGMYGIQREAAQADIRGRLLANEKLDAEAKAAQKRAGENYLRTTPVTIDGQVVAVQVSSYDPIARRENVETIKLSEPKKAEGEKIMSLFGQFADAQRRNDMPAMLEIAINYGKEANYSGYSPDALVRQMSESLAQQPALGSVGKATTSTGLNVTGQRVGGTSEERSPGAPPPPTGSTSQSPAAAVTPSGRAVATETMPPQPPAPSTTAEPAGFGANRNLPDPYAQNVYNPTLEQQRIEAGYPTQDELVQALAISAPPPPLVDTNIVPTPAPARVRQTPGFNYPAYSMLGIAERLKAESERKREEIRRDDEMLMAGVGRSLGQIPETLLRAGEAGIAGLMTGDYSMPEKSGMRRLGEAAGEAMSGSMASEIQRLQREDEVLRSRPNSIEAYDIRRSRGLPGPAREGAGYTRSFTAEEMDRAGAGQATAGRAEADSQINPNVSRGLMEIISPRPSQRVKTEKLTKERAKAEEPARRSESGVGLGLEVLPQINLSRDAKRIADLLLKEYEGNKKGQPSFTITANQGRGKDRTIKVSNPAILAVLSNPTMFERLIREGAAFSEASPNQLATRSLMNERMDRMAREAEMLRQLEVMGRRTTRGR